MIEELTRRLQKSDDAREHQLHEFQLLRGGPSTQLSLSDTSNAAARVSAPI